MKSNIHFLYFAGTDHFYGWVGWEEGLQTPLPNLCLPTNLRLPLTLFGTLEEFYDINCLKITRASQHPSLYVSER